MSKVVLVTGSAKGIGAAIIEELAAAGYDCVINYHTSEKEAFALQEKFPSSMSDPWSSNATSAKKTM